MWVLYMDVCVASGNTPMWVLYMDVRVASGNTPMWVLYMDVRVASGNTSIVHPRTPRQPEHSNESTGIGSWTH